MATKTYSKNKLKTLFTEAQALGIPTRKNMTGPTLERKIAEAQGGGTPAPTAAKPGPKPRAVKPDTEYLLYVVDQSTNELSFAVKQVGANGPAAAVAAVAAQLISPDTPIVALAPTVLANAVEVETETVFKPKSPGTPPAAPKAPAAPATPAAAPAAKAPAKAAAKPAAAKKGAAGKKAPARSSRAAKAPVAPAADAVAPAPPAPGVSPGNPFAE